MRYACKRPTFTPSEMSLILWRGTEDAASQVATDGPPNFGWTQDRRAMGASLRPDDVVLHAR